MTSPIGRGAPKFTQIAARNMGSLSGRVVRRGSKSSSSLTKLYVGAIGISAFVGGVKSSLEQLKRDDERSNYKNPLTLKACSAILSFWDGAVICGVMMAAFPLTIVICGTHLLTKKT